MPSRLTTLAIVVFWLAAMGWLFLSDIWPAIRPGDRPPFNIDLSKEVKGETEWTLHRNGSKIGYVRTSTRYNQKDDTYELITKVTFDRQEDNKHQQLKLSVPKAHVEIDRMRNIYRVTQQGELLAVDARVTATLHSTRPKAVTETIELKVEGQVEDGMFNPKWTFESTLMGNQVFQTDPIPIQAHSSMFNPMMPWHQLFNVKKRQRWRMSLFDPLGDSLGSIVGKKPGERFLEAGVLDETDDQSWKGDTVPCLVIEYRGDDLTGRTWVRESDGLVLRQEVVQFEGTPQLDRMVLERKPDDRVK